MDLAAAISAAQVAIPDNVLSGNYYITVWSDTYDIILEDTLASNLNPDDPAQLDNNNYKARAISVLGITPPDLAVTDVTGLSAADAGGSYTFSYTVQNLGDAFTGIWTDTVYVRGPHIVPLPPALLAALRNWRTEDGDRALYVCPAPRDPAKPVTPEGCEKFYRNALGLGGKHSPHSWRSAFSTVCREAGKNSDAVEAQLDHVVGTNVSSAYDRAKRLELRRELMRWYEGQLIAARDGAEVVQIDRQHA